MRFTKKFSYLMLFIMLFTVGFSACTPDTKPATKEEKVKLVFGWWGDKPRHDATNRAIKAWNKEHPDIQVEASFQGWDGYHEKLYTQLISNTAADIFQLDQTRFEEFASAGLLADLTPYTKTDFAELDQNLWTDLSYDGKAYAVAAGVNSDALLYNETKLENLGISLPGKDETWDTLLERCKATTLDTDGDGKKDLWGIFDPMDADPDYYNKYLKPFGLSFWGSDLKSCNFDNPEVVEALKKYSRFREQDVIVPPEVTLLDGQSYITAGLVAYQMSFLSGYISQCNNTTDKLGIVMPPAPPEGGVDARATYTSILAVVNNSSENKDAAVKFLSWLFSSPEAAKATGMVRGVFPSKTQRDASKEFSSQQEQKILEVAGEVAALENPVEQKVPKNFTPFLDVFTQEKNRYLLNLCTLEQFAKEVQKNGNPLLEGE
jgi:multiple sugar transport system substrate-binding protein